MMRTIPIPTAGFIMSVNNYAENFERTEDKPDDETDFRVVDAVVMTLLNTKSIDKQG
jgi:hypothetical protein